MASVVNNTNNFATTTTPRFNVPTGSSAGQLLVMGGVFENNDSHTISLASGVSQHCETALTGASAKFWVFSKVLDSTDISNGYVQAGTLSGSMDCHMTSVAVQDYDQGASNAWLRDATAAPLVSGTNVVTSSAITPTEDGALLIQFAGSGNNGRTLSSSDLTNLEVQDSGVSCVVLNSAAGPTPAASTGTKSVTFSGNDRLAAYYFWVRSPQDVTVAPSAISVMAATQAVSPRVRVPVGDAPFLVFVVPSPAGGPSGTVVTPGVIAAALASFNPAAVLRALPGAISAALSLLAPTVARRTVRYVAELTGGPALGQAFITGGPADEDLSFLAELTGGPVYVAEFGED